MERRNISFIRWLRAQEGMGVPVGPALHGHAFGDPASTTEEF